MWLLIRRVERYRVLVGVAVALLAVAIASPTAVAKSPFRDRLLTTQVLAVPRAEYTGFVWLDESHIVTTEIRVSDAIVKPIMNVFALSGGGSAPLSLAFPEPCLNRDPSVDGLLGPGRLLVSQTCSQQQPSTAFYTQLFEANPADGSLQLLTTLDAELAPEWVRWNAQRMYGVAADVNEVCSYARWIDRDGSRPIRARAQLDGRTFRLDRTSDINQCDRDPLVEEPSIAPDGRRIAFFAAPAVEAFTGLDRGFQPRGLFVLASDGSRARRLGHFTVVLPSGLNWSPDGKWLSFAGTVDGKDGAFLYDAENGSLIRYVKGSVGGGLFSPDGRRVALLRTADEEGIRLISEVVQVDVSTVLSGDLPPPPPE